MVGGLIATVALPAYGAWRPADDAMTLQQVAYVRALGQIELVFTFMASYFLFKERINRMEILGCLLIVSGILGLLAG